jgi:hypothetical protein
MTVKRESLVWLLLVSLTLASFALHREAASGAVALILGLAMAKIWLVASEYMELRHAPRWARALFLLWGGAVFSGVLYSFAAAG